MSAEWPESPTDRAARRSRVMESNNRTESLSCGDGDELAAQERWLEDHTQIEDDIIRTVEVEHNA